MNPIRLKDAAKKFGIPIKTLYSWNGQKKFPTVIFKLGGLVMFDEDEYLRVCRENAGQPESEVQEEKEKAPSSFLERARALREKKAKGTK